MAEDIAKQAVTERKKRNTDGRRSITFVYTSDEGERKVTLLKHKTKSFSVEEAWKECVEKHGLLGVTMTGALAGHHDYMENKIRKPTRVELLKLAGLSEND